MIYPSQMLSGLSKDSVLAEVVQVVEAKTIQIINEAKHIEGSSQQGRQTQQIGRGYDKKDMFCRNIYGANPVKLNLRGICQSAEGAEEKSYDTCF